MGSVMRRLLGTCIFSLGLFLAAHAPIAAQDETKKPEPAKVETKKDASEPPSTGGHYTLAAIAVAAVMLLICLPARRD